MIKQTTKNHANDLRKNLTKQEKHLWYDFLKNHKYKFYRQRIIGDYITDFYSAKAKLIIELDGSQHYEPEAIEYDNRRTEYFNKKGIRVLRFSNYDVDNNFEAVCMEIEKVIEDKIFFNCDLKN